MTVALAVQLITDKTMAESSIKVLVVLLNALMGFPGFGGFLGGKSRID